MEVLAASGLKLGADPLGGSAVHYCAPIAERYGLSLEIVNPVVDPTFAFMTLDRDGILELNQRAKQYPQLSYRGHKNMQHRNNIHPIGAAFAILFVLCGTMLASDGVVDKYDHFEKYDNGIVRDVKTGLQWYAGPDTPTTWSQAAQWVNDLDIDGDGWRMPTLTELKTLAHIGDGVRNIVPILNNSGYWLWAGQTPGEASKWLFGFSYGGEGWPGTAPEDGGRAMAVRSR